MMDSRKAVTVTVVSVLLCSTLSFFAGASGYFPRLAALVPHPAQSEKVGSTQGLNYQMLDRVRQEIHQNFLNPVPDDKLTEGALKGMVEATGDKYSVFFSAEEYKKFVDHLKSTMSGIGVFVEMSATTGKLTVVSPIKGSPGEKVGLRAGDMILTVDGKDITGLSQDEAIDMIRGPQGTQVKLTVAREGATEPLSFVVTRATIEMQITDAKMVDQANGVGYLQLREFSEKASERVARDLATLKSQGMKRLILDLRQNPGGYLDEAINVASLFVPKGKPVVFVEAKGEKVTYESKGNKEAVDMPLVVLVDNGSASASEIVAGALKDLKIGLLMGVKTFGKGSVQTFHAMPDGSGIKLTTARYLTAGGNSIHEKGIDPDVVKENPKDVLPGDPGDVQLQEAMKHILTMER